MSCFIHQYKDFLSLLFFMQRSFQSQGYFSYFIFNDNSIFFLMNIYSDSAQTVLKYLKNTEVVINNIFIIIGISIFVIIFGILTILIILPIAIYLLTLWIPCILVYHFLLTMFLLDTQTMIMTQTQLLI